jgi:TPR repeat protein
VIKLLESGGPNQLIGELERLSALGSLWASATLGYLSLLPGEDGKRDPKRAIELCGANAAGGDPYALFILAWALLHSGRRNLAIRTMKKAALSGFPPATLDYVTFVWNGWGTKAAYPSVALKLLRRADKAHHKAALIWKCKMYSSGKFGVLYACLGYVTLPFARLRYLLAALLNPFSCRVFVFQMSATGPVFRAQSDQR